ncbi:putative E3 ubiquitin-protein ligase RING1a [Sesamum angolense]|uniref:E3 ubiquitin-protein ligase RING1a n=1 Tax=Sesamum angolense TaxID=2727404 RepID=A0AAE2BV99_9LAMI|nr:putative E3 ubiquitin-protein ligase RING1a [Sesamum angolense]
MPAQKRPLETTTPPRSPPPPHEEEKADDSQQGSEDNNQKETDDDCDSDESPYSSDGEKDEFIVVKLAEIRKEVQCPICLGIIRKTRTVMECLHRFCRECIDKSMRLGNNECPACRTHCASRRSLRDDPNYDALIAALYPDIDKYEEEELAFHEEEKARNKLVMFLKFNLILSAAIMLCNLYGFSEFYVSINAPHVLLLEKLISLTLCNVINHKLPLIQASIAQTFRRQAEALGKKRTSARVTAAAFVRRQGNYPNSRGRRNHRVPEHQGSDEEEGANGNDGSKDTSSADERSPEVKSKRYKRWEGGRTSQQSSGANAEGGCDDNDAEANRELLGASVGLIGGTEILAWGRGGMRSNTRHGGLSWAGGKLSRNNRLSKLIDHLRCSNENDEVLNISLTLVTLLEEKIPSLKRPYLCCSPRSSVRHLCQYVAMQTSMEVGEIEILIVKDFHPINNPLNFKNHLVIINPCDYELQLLSEHQTLGEIHANFTQQNLAHVVITDVHLPFIPVEEMPGQFGNCFSIPPKGVRLRKLARRELMSSC